MHAELETNYNFPYHLLRKPFSHGRYPHSQDTERIKGDLLCLFPALYFYSGTPLELCMIHSLKKIFILYWPFYADAQFISCLKQADLASVSSPYKSSNWPISRKPVEDLVSRCNLSSVANWWLCHFISKCDLQRIWGLFQSIRKKERNIIKYVILQFIPMHVARRFCQQRWGLSLSCTVLTASRQAGLSRLFSLTLSPDRWIRMFP